MKIGINASYAACEKPTGIGNYILNLISNLLTIDKKNKYYLYYRKKIKKNQFLNFNVPSLSFEPKLSIFNKNKPDIFHDPSFKYIKIGKSKCLITIHDIVVAKKEDYTSTRFKKQQMPKLTKAIYKSDWIITVSEFTKKELLKYFPIKKDKITPVYHGVNSNLFKPGLKSPDFIKSNNLPKRYLFFVGNIEKRKNLFTIIKSFEKIHKKEKDLYLILAGKNGYAGEEIRAFIKKSPINNSIIELDYIPNNKLPLFYQNAELFIFPSYYEGFGIPILEALACGCPVITSNITAMPEAGGDAVVYVNPFDYDEIADKTLHLLHNKKLKQTLRNKGLKHIKNFTWEKTARKTLEVYQQLV